MTEAVPPAGAAAAASAGALLRAARERSGMNVEALAATVKVAPAKIEALEADRPEDLPDLTFARGLARNVCHVLATDPAPVLALMPRPPSLGPRLEQIHTGLKTPLRRHAGDAADRWQLARRPALWMPLLLLLAALAIFLAPQQRDGGGEASAPTPGTVSEEVVAALPPAAPASGVAASASAPAAAAMPASPPSAPAAAAPADAAAPLVRVQTDEEAWVEVREAGGRALVQRLLRAGETVEVAEGTPPLRVRIGNASAVRLAFRGEPVDLAPSTRSDVARLELK